VRECEPGCILFRGLSGLCQRRGIRALARKRGECGQGLSDNSKGWDCASDSTHARHSCWREERA
jgi:hypothetical protein